MIVPAYVIALPLSGEQFEIVGGLSYNYPVRKRRGRSATKSEFGSSSGTQEPLIGIENIGPPKWAEVDGKVANASFMQAVRTLPAAVKVVLRLAWLSSPRLTLLAGFLYVLSGCVTAFGLLATANVFTALLQEGPTPKRLVESLPAIAVVVVSYAGRALLDTAVALVEGILNPLVFLAADDEVAAGIVHVELLAFEDADFRELAEQGASRGVSAIGSSLEQLAALLAATISVIAAITTAGFLHPWLAPALFLAALADGWAAGRVAKLNYQHFITMATRNIRKGVIIRAATDRAFALERHALTLQKRLLEEYRRISRSLTREKIKLAHNSNKVHLIGRSAAGVGTGIAFLVLGFLLYTKNLELALAGTAALAMQTASFSLSTAMRQITLLYNNTFYIEFYKKLLIEAAQRRSPKSELLAPSDPREIRLDDVSFSYPGQKKSALSGLTVTIRRGEVVALVGENGSGKTTLGKILTGLYPPSQGRVFWDDADLAKVDLTSVHENIAVIAQHPAEWPMTAGHNIRVGRIDSADPGGSAWAEAIGKSGADEVLDSLPLGEKALLSRQFTDAQDLSGGQWQRIGVARGIYRDASVLIADEPTAALDAKAEAKVFASLQYASNRGGSTKKETGHRQGLSGQGAERMTQPAHDFDAGTRTTILVTHRLANIKHVDRIFVMDKGRITEQGTHAELIALKGQYHEMFEIQASAYRDSKELTPL